MSGEHRRVKAALAGTDADLGLIDVLTEDDNEGTLGRLAEQVAQALGILDGRAGRGVVVLVQRRPHQTAVEIVLHPCQDEAEQLQLRVRLGPIQKTGRDRERRAGGDQLSRDAQGALA